MPGELQGGGHCVAVPWVSDLGRLKHSQLVSYFFFFCSFNTMICFWFYILKSSIISKRGCIKKKSSNSGNFLSKFQNQVKRNITQKKAIDLEHQPELGACPCMRVGGFKRNPTGFSSGETEHKRRPTLKKKKDPRVTTTTTTTYKRVCYFCLCTFLTTGPVTTATLVQRSSCNSSPVR